MHSFFQTKVSAILIVVASTVLLLGCTTYAPSPRLIGMSQEQVVAVLGTPYPTPVDLSQAKRLDFPRGPHGKHTYSVLFDAEGKATGFRQLLTEENFREIRPGMDVSAVIELIGISRDTFGLARNRGYVWNFRYITPLCRWFQIEFTAEHKVRSSGYGMPPECRPKVLMVQ